MKGSDNEYNFRRKSNFSSKWKHFLLF
jgi:hypothetical protein